MIIKQMVLINEVIKNFSFRRKFRTPVNPKVKRNSITKLNTFLRLKEKLVTFNIVIRHMTVDRIIEKMMA
jgi:hypothetical protein